MLITLSFSLIYYGLDKNRKREPQASQSRWYRTYGCLAMYHRLTDSPHEG